MLYACDFILNSPRMKKYQTDVNIPSIFHLTCLSGCKSKMNYLLKSDLLFYDPVSLKCSGENAMKNIINYGYWVSHSKILTSKILKNDIELINDNILLKTKSFIKIVKV